MRYILFLSLMFSSCNSFLNNPHRLSIGNDQDKLDHSKECPKDCKACNAAVEKAFKYIVGEQKESGEIKAKKLAHAIHTSLAGLAYICRGSTIEKGDYKENLKKCKEYLDKWKQNDKKYYAPWSVIYTLLFYTQLQIVSPSDEIKKRVEELAERLVKIQHPKGGWAHQFAPKEAAEYPYSFPSGTILGLWALYQAKQAGVKIEDKVFDIGLDHIKDSINKEGCIEHGDGAGEDSRNAAKTAAGLGIFQLVNREKDKEAIKKMEKYVEKHMPKYKGIHDDEHSQVEIMYPFAAITIEKMGKREWLKNLREFLVKEQDQEGAWRVPPLRRGGDWFEGKFMTSAGFAIFLLAQDSKLTFGKISSKDGKKDMDNHVNTLAQLLQLQSSLDLFKLDCGKFPEKLEYLSKTPSGLEKQWKGPYATGQYNKDQWGNEIIYKLTDKNFQLSSYGADGKEGGEGWNKDIIVPQPKNNK